MRSGLSFHFEYPIERTIERTMSTIRAASDVGGTFTDLVYFVIDEQSGKITDIKLSLIHI